MGKVVDLTGMTFGRLTVLRRVANNAHGDSMWECQCSCPNHTIIIATGSGLRCGDTQSCGCLQRERASQARLKDLTGKTFGRLTVIKRVENSNDGHAQWLCECSCPNHTRCVVTGHNLLNGTTRSCGCLAKELASIANTKDLTGQTFGRLTVLRRDPENTNTGNAKWIVQCSCHNHTVFSVAGTSLVSGNTKSCGCLRSELNTERLTKWRTPEERELSDRLAKMKQRCYNPNDDGYKDYGQRGITICDEWLHDTNSFVKWGIENGFDPSLSINRIDNDGPYSPENCEWANSNTQQNNKRSNVRFEVDGDNRTIAEWSDITDISYSHLMYLYNTDPQRLMNEIIDSRAYSPNQ